MIPINHRAEKVVIDALLNSEDVVKIYTNKRIFQGFAAPNTLSSVKEYILVQRVSSVALDRVLDGTATNKLRKVRIQIDVSDIDYTKMVARAEKVMQVLEDKFPSCVDGDTFGTVLVGQTVFNVCSIDVIINESED